MLRVCAVCGTDFGIGDVLGGMIREALDDQGVRYDLEVVDVNQARDYRTDLIFMTDDLAGLPSDDSVLMVGIQNFTSRSEVREKVSGALQQMRLQTGT